MKPLLIVALTAIGVAVHHLYRLARDPEDTVDADDYAEPVPMAAWDGTAQYDGNSHTIRVRWAPTSTEVRS